MRTLPASSTVVDAIPPPPPRAGDVQHSLADIGKARRLLGYSPVVPFAEGLRRLEQWTRAPSA